VTVRRNFGLHASKGVRVPSFRNSSKYLSESLSKVVEFQNAGYIDTPQQIVEFTLDKGGYDELMSTAVDQAGSKGIDAVKINLEGLSASSARNIGVPITRIDQFNKIILNVRKVQCP